MAEVDDVARGGGALVDDALGASVQRLNSREQQRGIEVALQHVAPAQQRGGLGQRGAVIDAEHARSRLAERGQQVRGIRPEVNARNVGVSGGDGGEHALRIRHDVRPVVRLGERSDPRIEQLHDARAGAELGEQEAGRQVRAPAHEGVPARGIGVHEGARGQVVLGRPAVNEVGGEREGRPCEGDDGGGIA